MLTQAKLKEILHYNPDTGVFTRLYKTSHKTPEGSRVGHIGKDGYRRWGFDGKSFYEHRLAWLYMQGINPCHEIDHINGIRDDNRFCNLRECSRRENMQNQNIMKRRNTSGVLGVSWSNVRNKWVSQIEINGKGTTLGRFDCIEDAKESYLLAKEKLHPFFRMENAEA